MDAAPIFHRSRAQRTPPCQYPAALQGHGLCYLDDASGILELEAYTRTDLISIPISPWWWHQHTIIKHSAHHDRRNFHETDLVEIVRTTHSILKPPACAACH
ncbi:hypothetical protein C8Q73DRAFT_440995 [Cubamyces lactineus]|nr:hypothetical protein C8Q73DRAFT_440995 [Cubamyces lactineus]